MEITNDMLTCTAPKTIVAAFYRLALEHGHFWPTGKLEGLQRLEKELEETTDDIVARQWGEVMNAVSEIRNEGGWDIGVYFPRLGEPLAHTTLSGRSTWVCDYVMGRAAVVYTIDRPNGVCLRAKLSWGEDDYGEDDGLQLDVLSINEETKAEGRHWDTLIRLVVQTLVLDVGHVESDDERYRLIAGILRESAKEDLGIELPEEFWKDENPD